MVGGGGPTQSLSDLEGGDPITTIGGLSLVHSTQHTYRYTYTGTQLCIHPQNTVQWESISFVLYTLIALIVIVRGAANKKIWIAFERRGMKITERPSQLPNIGTYIM